MAKKRFFLIDGCTLAYRTRHEFNKQPLINSKGMNTTTIFTFVSTIFSILEEEEPTYLAVVFDSERPSFRHKIYSDYKTTLERLPEEILKQLPYLYKILDALSLAMITVEGYEADDVISAYVKEANSYPDLETYIVSGEKNVMQLVNEKVFLYQTKGLSREIWGAERILEKFSVNPEQIVDFLSLMGDQSDNIPGVPAIGERSACFLLQEYNSVENALSQAKTIKRKNVRENLLKNRDSVLLSKNLVSLKQDVPLGRKINDLRIGAKNETVLLSLFQNFEFPQYLSKLSKEQQQRKQDFYLISSKHEFDRFLKLFQAKKKFSFHFLKDVEEESIIGIAIAFSSSISYYLPLETDSDQERLLQLAPFFANPEICKIGFDLKKMVLVLRELGLVLDCSNAFDTMIAGALQKPGVESYELKKQIFKHLNIILETSEDLKNRYPRGYLTKRQLEIACDYATCIWSLAQYHCESLKESHLYGFFENVELKLEAILIEIEARGIYFDRDQWLGFILELTTWLQTEENSLQEQLGKEVSLQDNKALNEFLSQKLKSSNSMSSVSKGKNASNGFLEKEDVALLTQHLLAYQKNTALKNAFAEVYHDATSLETQRYCPEFSQLLDPYGRILVHSPLLENLDFETSSGRKIRKAFIAKDEEHLLIWASYENLMVTLFAYFSQDKQMISWLEKEEDFFALLGEHLFKRTKHTEKEGGKSAFARTVFEKVLFGNHKDCLIVVEDLKRYQKILTETFSTFFQWQENILELLKKNGKVVTLCGRSLFFQSGLLVSHKKEFSRIQQDTLLSIIMGSISELLKIALVSLYQKIETERLKTVFLLPVKEGFLFEVPKLEEKVVLEYIKKEMQTVVCLNVPLKIRLGIGASWQAAYADAEPKKEKEIESVVMDSISKESSQSVGNTENTNIW